MSKQIDIVFDGPPSHDSPRFIEVEDSQGRSIDFGEWGERANGTWALRFTMPTDPEFTDDEWETIRSWVRGIDAGLWNPTSSTKRHLALLLRRLFPVSS